MASKLECKKAGDTLTMHCATCEVVESMIKNKDGTPQEQVKFTDGRGDYLFLPRETADRQLVDRCGFGERVDVGGGKVGYNVLYSDVDGSTLVFSRTPNKNAAFAPYWNVEVVTEPAPRPSLTAAAKAEAERVRVAKGLPKDEDSLGPQIPGLDDEDSAYLESLAEMGDDGLPPVKAGMVQVPGAPDLAYDKAGAYFALVRRVAEFQAEIGTKHECPFDLASINAMSFSIWNTR